MHYMGGKGQGSIGRDIAATIQAMTPPGRPWVEPFVGACGVLRHVSPQRHPVRIGADLDSEIIALWTALLAGWDPPSEVTREQWRAIKEDKTAPPHLRAFVGYGCSYGGMYFRGYAAGFNHGTTTYPFMARSAVLKKAAQIAGTRFVCAPYDALPIPAGAIVYCDPPYAGTTAPGQGGAFDSAAFWEWAINLDKTCHVFVSEYSAPAGWREVWRKDGKKSLSGGRHGVAKERAERLFMREARLPLIWGEAK